MLTHYESVVKNMRPPKYLVCKRIRKRVDIFRGFQDALKIHGELSAVFREVYKEIINGFDESGLKDFEGLNYLEIKKSIVEKILEECILCERRCGVNRVKGNIGFCGVNKTARVSSYFLHMGEESQLIPSGTVFFSGCTFRCAYNTCL